MSTFSLESLETLPPQPPPYSSLPVTSYPTASTAATSTPTPYPGDDKYQLLSCYNELADPASGRALGAPNAYVSPIFSFADALTVPLCLESCGLAQAPDGKGVYIYAAVENSRECYCGLTLSNSSKAVDESNCSWPCPAAPDTACGGFGYLNLYQLRSALTSTSILTSPTSSINTEPSTLATSAADPKFVYPATSPPRHHLNLLPFWVALPIFVIVLAALIFGFFILRRKKVAERRRSVVEDEVVATASMEPEISFVGGYALNRNSSVPRMGVPRSKDEAKTEQQARLGLGVRRTPSSRQGEDGRRFGVIVEGGERPRTIIEEENGVGILGRGEGRSTTEENRRVDMGRTEARGRLERRDTLDAWKRGVVPPLKRENATVGERSDSVGGGGSTVRSI